jgi:hypothetical protein
MTMNNTDATPMNVRRPRARTAHARVALLLTLSSTMGAAGTAYAGTPSAPTVVGTTTAPALTPPETEPPYSLPWQLRPIAIGNALRVDSVAAVFNDAQGNLDEAVATVLSASYQITREWAPMVRLGFVGNDAPGAAVDGSSFANPVVGATYARRMGRYSLALFGATTIPIGMGGGDAPNPGAAKTNAASSTARPADNAMFAVNDLTEIVGADFAYVNYGFTAQAEATLLQFIRVRGGDSAGATDAFRTRSAVGLHVGYFIGSHCSLGADLSYQRWLSHPTAVNASTGARVPLSDADMDTLTAAAGPRVHFRLGKHAWIRPGLSFVRGFDARGFDAPLLTAQATAVQLDIPVTF